MRAQDANEVRHGAEILEQQTATLDSVVAQVAVRRACARVPVIVFVCIVVL